MHKTQLQSCNRLNGELGSGSAGHMPWLLPQLQGWPAVERSWCAATTCAFPSLALQLARIQTDSVVQALQERHPHLCFEIGERSGGNRPWGAGGLTCMAGEGCGVFWDVPFLFAP